MSVDGNVVAFDAFGSFNDAFTGGAANRRQVFVRNLTTGHITPVTGDSAATARAHRSTRRALVVFESTAPLLGGTTGIRQVFMYSIQSGLLWQITNGAGPSRGGMFNRVGTHLAFSSTADLKGDGHDTGISQIFWYDKVERDALPDDGRETRTAATRSSTSARPRRSTSSPTRPTCPARSRPPARRSTGPACSRASCPSSSR